MAYHSQDFSPREKDIIAVLQNHFAPQTDREIADLLGSKDLNYSRPRVSEMLKRGILAEALSIECPVTGKEVRTVYVLAKVMA